MVLHDKLCSLPHSVDRDDLPDGGSTHIARTIALLKERTSGRLLVEALVPDFQGDMGCVRTIVDSGLDVFAHNIETVERLQGEVRDRRAAWKQSLGVRGIRAMRISWLGCFLCLCR